MSFSDRCDNDSNTHTLLSFTLQKGKTVNQKARTHLSIFSFQLTVLFSEYFRSIIIAIKIFFLKLLLSTHFSTFLRIHEDSITIDI